MRKKNALWSKIADIENGCITTADYNKFAHKITEARKKAKELVNKPTIAGFIDIADLYRKISLATKAEQDKK